MKSEKILIIDDESSIRSFLRVTLEASHYTVTEATTGESALEILNLDNFSLIILDYGLPGISGLEVLKLIREKSQTPVIFLTVRDNDEDKVNALDSGADDYLTKPFSVPELMARIRVALRHSIRAPSDQEKKFNFDKLKIDTDLHKIFFEETDLKLTSTEYELLKLLIINGERLVPHKAILKAVWGPNAVEQHHYLRVYFGQIRKKLEKIKLGAGHTIENESGLGYRLRYI